MVKFKILAVPFLVLTYVSALFAIDITIDHTVQYQKMVGFGGQCDNKTFYNGPAASLVTDVGVSVVRFDWSLSWDVLPQFAVSGVRTFVGSCWSPPANMKDNGTVEGGGHLLASKYEAFGDYAIQQLLKFKNQFGFELYALSPQNEPSVAVFYASCLYGDSSLIKVCRVIARKIDSAGLHTKLFLPDDIYVNWNCCNKPAFILPLIKDKELSKKVVALAFHNYESNGITPATMKASVLAGMYNDAHANGWELWQTEAAGAYGMDYAYGAIACLRYGKVSMFMKYGMIAETPGMIGDPNEYYVTAGQKTLTYYIGKCFSKFIRPGSIQLRSVPSDSATFCSFVTFIDPAARALIVTLATSGTAQNIALKGSNLPATLQKWVASSTVNCVNQGDVSSTSTINIPANSVVTLYGTGYNPPGFVVAALPQHTTHAAGIQNTRSAPIYDISGKRIATIGKNHKSGLGIVVKNGHAQLKIFP
jgi:O-glycosyl hydrolase